MSTVVGKTSIKIDELVEGTVVSGYVNGSGQLILVTRGGAEILAGFVGAGGAGDPADLSRLVIYSDITAGDFASLGLTDGATGSIDLPAWYTPDEEVGTSFDYSVPSRISLLEDGIYAITFQIKASGISNADVATSLQMNVVPNTLVPHLSCALRGGDVEVASYPSLPSAAFTYYTEVVNGEIDWKFAFENFDAVNITGISLGVSIQKLSLTVLSEGGGGEQGLFGTDVVQTGVNSNAGGENSQALGDSSLAVGSYTEASGFASIAEGNSSIASGNDSHAEGYGTQASGNHSHAEGDSSIASDASAHAEGRETTASGEASHSEGRESVASGFYSHAEGQLTQATGQRSHAEGYITVASGSSAHAEGTQTLASQNFSHAEGGGTQAIATYAHAEGRDTIADGSPSHSEGWDTHASGDASHAEGRQSVSSGDYSHGEGYRATASGSMSHAEGDTTTASGDASHSEGDHTLASGISSHAEGVNTKASGDYSHVQGDSGNAFRALEDSVSAAQTKTLQKTNLIIVGDWGTDNVIIGGTTNPIVIPVHDGYFDAKVTIFKTDMSDRWDVTFRGSNDASNFAGRNSGTVTILDDNGPVAATYGPSTITWSISGDAAGNVLITPSATTSGWDRYVHVDMFELHAN